MNKYIGSIVAGAEKGLPDSVKDFSRGGYLGRLAAKGALNGYAIRPDQGSGS